MKILVVGASGTLGQAVASSLGTHHELIRAGRHSGDVQVDLTDDASVQALFARTGSLDAVVATTGRLHFGPVADMTPAQFNLGLQDKLLGQVRLAQRRLDHPDQRHHQRAADPRRGQRHGGECGAGRLRSRGRLRPAAARAAHQRGESECAGRVDGRLRCVLPRV